MSSASESTPPEPGQPSEPERQRAEKTPKSFGPMSNDHWTKTRAEANPEALSYLRSRNEAPGVEGGGSDRNFWCMDCGGVIPFEESHTLCPHCGATLEGDAKRYFNWVEIDRPVESEFKNVWPLFLGGSVLLIGFVWLVFALVVG